jgi:hypothetical protein
LEENVLKKGIEEIKRSEEMEGLKKENILCIQIKTTFRRELYNAISSLGLLDRIGFIFPSFLFIFIY